MSTQNPNHNSHTILDENVERSYWQDQFNKEPYYENGQSYEDYQHAYQTGYQGHGRYQGSAYDQVENDLKTDWERGKGETRLGWDKARLAIKAAWHRIERALPGDADGDGR